MNILDVTGDFFGEDADSLKQFVMRLTGQDLMLFCLGAFEQLLAFFEYPWERENTGPSCLHVLGNIYSNRTML